LRSLALRSSSLAATAACHARRVVALRLRLRRMPRTSSFPSGHSASALAFAVAATRELPEAGPLLLPLATAVAHSRVYAGGHHRATFSPLLHSARPLRWPARSALRRFGIGETAVPRHSQAPSCSASCRWVRETTSPAPSSMTAVMVPRSSCVLRDRRPWRLSFTGRRAGKPLACAESSESISRRYRQ
jgi:PAP2 superfamily